MSKRFSKKDYLENDPQAKAAYTQVLRSEGYTVPDNQEEQYTHDLVAYTPDGRKVTFELETKSARLFELLMTNFDTIHVPERKITNKNISDWYIVYDKSYKRFFKVAMDFVKSEHAAGKVVWLKPANNDEKEPFVDVDKTLSEFFTVDENSNATKICL